MTALITPEGLARLDAALAWIDEHPEQHDQGMWFERIDCGTRCCLAGAVAMLAGDMPVWRPSGDAFQVRLPDGKVHDVDWRAARLLGIAFPYTTHLFYTSTTRADLGRIRDELAVSLEPTL